MKQNDKSNGDPQARMDFENGFRTAQEGLELPADASESAKNGYMIGLSTPATGMAGTSPVGGFKSSKKYFHALNSNRFIKSKSFTFSFSPYQHCGGIWMGTYATDDTEQIAALEALPDFGTEKCSVSEISKDEYDDCQKKKAVSLQGLGQSLIHSEAQASPHRSVSPAEVLNTEPPPPAPSAPPVESVDALEIGESKIPEA